MLPTSHREHRAADDVSVERVKRLFSEITPRYDLMNHLLSARQDIHWRRFTVKRIPPEAKRILDIAAGTGDLTIETVRRRGGASVFGLDLVEKMMDSGRIKAEKKGLKVHWITGDALKLPFADDKFDAATIAFGLRNIPDRQGVVAEMARVVKPGGKVLALEMTFSRNLRLRKFFHWYLEKVIPALGGLFARNRKAYSYLAQSIREFIPPEELCGMFENAGLKSVKAFPLSLGITYLHEGVVSD